MLDWEVKIARIDTDDFRTIGQGSGEIIEGVIATFDPTILPNDNYRIQIWANDGVHNLGIEFQYGVAGDYKLGNFTVQFTDLTIPVAGIPLVVTRQYNSLDTSPGDFGPGWRLGLAGRATDNAVESMTGNELVDLLASEPFRAGTRVYVTRPDGRRVGFTFAPVYVFGLTTIVKFEPDPGVTDSLQAIDPLITYSGGFELVFFGIPIGTPLVALNFIIPFNPRILGQHGAQPRRRVGMGHRPPWLADRLRVRRCAPRRAGDLAFQYRRPRTG